MPGTAVTAVPHVSIRWRYESGDGSAGLRGRKGEGGGVRFRRLLLTGHLAAIISKPSDLTRKRRPKLARLRWPHRDGRLSTRRVSCQVKRISPIFSFIAGLIKLVAPLFNCGTIAYINLTSITLGRFSLFDSLLFRSKTSRKRLMQRRMRKRKF